MAVRLRYASAPDRLLVRLQELAKLPREPPPGLALVAGPRVPGRWIPGLTGALGTAVWELLPTLPGQLDVAGHHLVRCDDAASFAAAGAALGRTARPGRPLACVIPTKDQDALRGFLHQLVLATQVLRPPDADRVVDLWLPGPLEPAARTVQVALRVLLARRLANTPSAVKSPEWLVEQAAEAVAGPGVTVRRRGRPWLERHGFGGLLAVAAGSSRPPAVALMTYRGGPGPHVVLVGKGVTFDSGGLSLKPAAGMTLMRTDMGGAAAVIGTIAAVRDLGLPVHVTGIIGCVENLPGAAAMRPGDVVRHVNGRTTEVLNTDAEGRLVLADCLAYANRHLAPGVLVDIATLTGSATAGLGRQYAALYSGDDLLAKELTAAGDASGDRAWRMPLPEEYRGAISSEVADAANTNTDPFTSAGSITAAQFLQPFAGGVPWAHLDIAGTGRTESDRPDCRKGATGAGVSLLTQWLAGSPRGRRRPVAR